MTKELLITILGISGVQIDDISLNNEGELIIHVSSTIVGTKCPKCGRNLHEICHSDYEVRLRHLPTSGHITYIVISPLRYKCGHCGITTTQEMGWYEQRHSCTKAYEEHLLLLVINSTIEDVSIKEKIGYDAIKGIIDRRVNSKVNWDAIQKIDVLGIDEISLKKGHDDFVIK